MKPNSKLLAQVDPASTFSAGSIEFRVDAYSIVRLGGDPPRAEITLDDAELQGGLIQFQAVASERFGKFGFKKTAVSTIDVKDSKIAGTSVVMDASADTHRAEHHESDR
jgi:hypothetical protein